MDEVQFHPFFLQYVDTVIAHIMVQMTLKLSPTLLIVDLLPF